MIPHPCRHFEWRCDLFCSRHYKSNKSYCTVERRNGRYRIFEWFFDRPSRPVIARVLRAIRNEWLKTRNCARFISERAEITYDTHVCARMRTRGWERREGWGIFSGMTVQLLPYDAIKQNTPRALRSELRSVPPLRVNDVTIMSPSRIITIAADTDLYNAKRSGNPGSNMQSPLADSPNCTSFLVARHFLNSDVVERGRKNPSLTGKVVYVAYFRNN